MKILGVEKAVFSDDFSYIVVHLRTDEPKPLTLEFSTDTLQDGLLRVWRALQSAGTDALIKTNDLQTSINVIDARVSSSDTTGIQLTLTTEQGGELRFAMGVNLSSIIREKMKVAEEKFAQ
jgi:hypothetical protein